MNHKSTDDTGAAGDIGTGDGDAELALQLEKTQSVAAPPDNGLVAWLQVLASFCVFFSTWGIINSFGVFQTFYQSTKLPTETNSAISWIGSLQGFLVLASSLVVGPLFDKGYYKHLLYTGIFLIVFGMMMTSLCETYYQFLLAQGICVGLGNGMLFVPSLAIIPTYFSSKRSVAMGIAASGSSLGGVIFPIIFQNLQPSIGFPWTVRVIAFIMLGLMLLTVAVTRLRVMPQKARPLLDLKAFKYSPYSFFTLACFFGFAGIYIPFFYIQQYTSDKAHTTGNLAFYTLSVMNAMSIVGRVLPGLLADHMGPLNTMVAFAAPTAILAFCWIAIHGTAGIYVFSALYGFFSGTFVSLMAAVIAHMVPKYYLMGTWIGMAAFAAGLGLLVGNPVAGAILSDGSWLGLQLYCGVLCVVAVGLLIGTRIAKVGVGLRIVA